MEIQIHRNWVKDIGKMESEYHIVHMSEIWVGNRMQKMEIRQVQTGKALCIEALQIKKNEFGI